MTTITRPKIFEPSIRLYERSVHPEFFLVAASQTIQRSNYEVSLAITSVGHIIGWTDGQRVLTEVLSTNVRELPVSDLFCLSLSGHRGKAVVAPKHDFYQNSSLIEDVPPEFFGRIEKEFLSRLEPNGLFYHFGFTGRMNLGGMSYLGAESRTNRFTVRAIHTFPDDSTILKTETVFLYRAPETVFPISAETIPEKLLPH